MHRQTRAYYAQMCAPMCLLKIKCTWKSNFIVMHAVYAPMYLLKIKCAWKSNFIVIHAVQVLEEHIACAAFELPLCVEYDEKYFGSALDGAITALKNKGYLGSESSDQLEASSTRIWNYIGPEVTFIQQKFLSWHLDYW